MLAFNWRVLAQATRPDIPLLERLRYITIVSSNLDEFFEVRLSDLMQKAGHPDSGVSMHELISVADEAHRLVHEQYKAFNDQVMPALAEQGIKVLAHKARSERQAAWVARFFKTEVLPLLFPIGLDPSHPFPQIANKSLNFIAKLEGMDAFGRSDGIAIVRVPRVLPRVIRLPDQLNPGEQCFVLLTSVIRAHLQDLFPGRVVASFSQFRVTRDSDVDVDEDEVIDLRLALRDELSKRNYGAAIRLEIAQSCPGPLAEVLQRQFKLPSMAVYRVDGPVNLVRLGQLIDQVDAPDLRFPTFHPAWPAGLVHKDLPVLPQMAERDILMHHPFESFDPVVQFLREAVQDPAVLAIRQTIYRTGGQSEMMDLLIEAARRGKEVLAVVELKARFDEEANINWAERLEAVGAQVVYGIVGHKTHAKMLLVTRREATTRKTPRLKHYLHLSTGNYNANTARLYTDLGLLTTDRGLTQDAEALFRHLASLSPLPALKHMLVAPQNLQSTLVDLLAKVTEASRAGYRGRVVAKFNALTDPVLINALMLASQAGALVDLVVRGACIHAPGVPGLTDNVSVRSVIGRFLEHTRIFYFRWGDDPSEEVMYLSSADWMSRNMKRRVEIAWPIRDTALRQRIIDECLVPYLHDGKGTWRLRGDGQYHAAGESGVHLHDALLALYAR